MNFLTWFIKNGKVLKNINTRAKVFKGLKKSRLHIDTELYKKARYNIKINYEKRVFFDDKLLEYIGKPKELWEMLKFSQHAKKNH